MRILLIKDLAKTSGISEHSLGFLKENKPDTYRLLNAGAIVSQDITGELAFHETAAKTCKQYGLKSLKVLCSYTDQSTQTLTNWFNNKPKAFGLILIGTVIENTFLS